MGHWQVYHIAHSVTDALAALAAAPGPARVIAGGTDLLLDIEQGRHPPVHTLVDITRIPDLTVIEPRSDSLFIGAAVPLSRIVASPAVGYHAQALVQACALIGGPQVRNVATLGGNVAHALPAADGAIALIALDATAEIADRQGRRRQPVADLYRGPGRSALDPQGELVVGFHLPLRRDGQASAFRRVMRPQGVAIAILNMAVWLERRDDAIATIRIAAGPTGPTPRRLSATEQALCGRAPTEAVLSEAVTALLGEAHFRTSPHRSSAAYRRHLAAVLLRETIMAAWDEAGSIPAGAIPTTAAVP